MNAATEPPPGGPIDLEKRRLLGLLALLAPLPLPFNDVVGWPAVLVFELAVGWFLHRTAQGATGALPGWAMNLLGLGYLPILAADLPALWRSTVLQPLVHLAMFALAVKLFGLRRERDKWHVFLVIFFLFLASMGTSVNPAVALYLAAFLAGGALLLARFAALHVLGSFDRGAEAMPLGRFLAVTCVLALMAAVPLFALLPRLGTPYVVLPGGAAGLQAQQVGYRDRVTLETIGRVRTSRAVALRVAYDEPPPDDAEMRLKAATFSEFHGDSWRRGGRSVTPLRRGRERHFELAAETPGNWARIWLQPTADGGLVLPVESVALDSTATALVRDDTGVVWLYQPSPGLLSYRAGLGPDGLAPAPGGPPEFDQGLPGARAQPAPAEFGSPPAGRDLALDGVTREIERLAAEVAGQGPAAERAARLEDHLLVEYDYTLDLLGSASANPVEDFLLRWGRGHCEYFASALVLMLRAQGIPARLVTGYLGGEYNPFEGFYVVRQSNAHAWVEAELGDGAWAILDPTPPTGRPQVEPAGLGRLLGQAYDFLLFRWDQYVLTYSFYDQIGLARRAQELWYRWWRRLRRHRDRAPAADPWPTPTSRSEPAPADRGPLLPTAVWLPLALAAAGAALWLWRHRPAPSATRSYLRLRRRLAAASASELPASVPPLALATRLATLHPAAATPGRRVVDLYLRERFANQPLTDGEHTELRTALRAALRGLRRVPVELEQGARAARHHLLEVLERSGGRPPEQADRVADKAKHSTRSSGRG